MVPLTGSTGSGNHGSCSGTCDRTRRGPARCVGPVLATASSCEVAECGSVVQSQMPPASLAAPVGAGCATAARTVPDGLGSARPAAAAASALCTWVLLRARPQSLRQHRSHSARALDTPLQTWRPLRGVLARLHGRARQRSPALLCQSA